MPILNKITILQSRNIWRPLMCATSSEFGTKSNSLNPSQSGGRVSAAVALSSKDGSEDLTSFDLNPPKGTRDFYPEDKRLSNWLFDHFRRVANVYGFEEYDAPILEKEILYIRKSGDEVTGQLYNFVDKGENRVSLRPEMTPSLARMVLAKKNSLSLPLKWFSIPQCWRYERTTRGRRREHYQWNMDIWGVSGVEAEVELLSAIVTCFDNLSLSHQDIGIKINSRKILEDIMKKVGVEESKWAPACVLIDKLDKQPKEAILNELSALGLADQSAFELVNIIEKKDFKTVVDFVGETSEGVQDIKKLFSLAVGYGISDWLIFDASVVRGLSYYTGIVFEGFDKTGQLRAICGGGRYDKLIQSMSAGETSIPAVGFGFGDAVIVELLKMKNLLPDLTVSKIDILVYYMSDSDPVKARLLQQKAIVAATQLRKAGFITDIVLEDKKPKWAFQRADRLQADYVVMYAGDEASRNEVVVKDMRRSTQTVIREEVLITHLNQNRVTGD